MTDIVIYPSRSSTKNSSSTSQSDTFHHFKSFAMTKPIEEIFIGNESHYDFPTDLIQRLRDDEQPKIVPSVIPFNILKPMNHLNTKFIKPTRIERPLPKLVFQDNETEEISTKDDQSKTIDTSLFDESDCVPHDSRSSSSLFFEQPGLTELDDDPIKESRRVRFSTAPIRVYPTYSATEYDRRNEDIDPFSASAEYELEKRIEKMDLFRVDIEKGSDGLGMSVLGMGVGADSGLEKLGIFVKALNPQGVISRDGRIQIGDQIIEVNEHYMVGVTHAFATTILKNTSGSVTFLIGREKDAENSEVLRLIQRSLQMDQERDDTPETKNSQPIKETNNNEYEMEILKECFESLEKTLESVEKEKNYYQLLYQQTLKDLQEMQEKYLKATESIREMQNRETQLNQEQTEKQKQQQKFIGELIKKIEALEQVIATAAEETKEKASLVELNTERSRPVESNQNSGQQRSLSVNSKSSTDRKALTLKTTPTQSNSLGNVANALESEDTNDNTITDEYLEVKNWTSDHCIQWLTNEEMKSFIPLFLNRSIDGEKLLSLDSSKMKAMGLKSSKDRDRLKSKLKELKHTDLDQIRNRLLSQPCLAFERVLTQGNRLRSSSLTKLKDRRFFSTNNQNCYTSKS